MTGLPRKIGDVCRIAVCGGLALSALVVLGGVVVGPAGDPSRIESVTALAQRRDDLAVRRLGDSLGDAEGLSQLRRELADREVAVEAMVRERVDGAWQRLLATAAIAGALFAVGFVAFAVPAMRRRARRAARATPSPAMPASVAGAIVEQIVAPVRDGARDAHEGSRVRGEFLTMMSHELRTPLNAVLGAADLLRSTRLDAEQADLVATAEQSGRLLLSVVDGILDLVEIEAQRLRIEEDVYDLELELEGVVRASMEQASAKDLGFDLRFDDELPDLVVGDPGRLRQVMLALVSNALKFTDRGRVCVEATRVPGATPAVRIEVTDTGMGIGREQLERLFAPFEQGDGSRTRTFGGTGLGLALARRLTEGMGGRIGVQSTPGLGSTFSIVLPTRAPSELQRLDYQSTLPLRGRRVLLLTGNEDLAIRTTGQLLSQGCEVSLFSPARAGDLTHAPDLAWDCVVIDIDVVAKAGIDWDVSSLPVVVLGNSRVLKQGELVRTPVRKRDLLLAVQRACTLRRLVASGDLVDRRRRVLVAEDNAVNRKVVAKMLEALDCDVVLASDGREAVAAWQSAPFDLVLMDFQMPVMDGPQAARRIRELEPDRTVPILAFTANTGSDIRATCRAAGMDGYLPKPLRRADLEVALAHWVPKLGDAHADI